MKIIFLEAAQNFGGSKRSVIDIAVQLKSLGHEVLVVDFWGANREFNDSVRSKGLELRVLDPRADPLILTKKGFFPRISSITHYFIKRLRYKARFSNLAKHFNPDYVCVNWPKALDILSASEEYKIDYYARGWALKDTFKDKYLKKKYKPRFVAISEASRHAIFISGNARLSEIKVLKVALGEQEFQIKKPTKNVCFNSESPMRLLHAGTFIESKGQHIAINVAKKLKEQGVDFKLTLAGVVSPGGASENYLAYLKQLVSLLGLEGEVDFLINNHDLADEMLRADVFIYPSYTEGLSRVCLEAMSLGKPIIANPVGGINDFLINGYNGYLPSFNEV